MQLLFHISPVAEALQGSAAKGLCSWRLKGHLLLPGAQDAAILWEETVLAALCPAFCRAGRMKPRYSALESHWNCSLCLVFFMCLHGRRGEAAYWELPVCFLLSRYGEALACLVYFNSGEMLLFVWELAPHCAFSKIWALHLSLSSNERWTVSGST